MFTDRTHSRALARRLVGILLALACSQARADDGRDSSERVRLTGFSVALPADLAWQPIRRQAFEVTLARNAAGQGPSYAATASLIGLPLAAATDEALLEFVKTTREQSVDRSRFRVVSDEQALSKDRPVSCVGYHTEVEDHGQARGGGPVFALDIVGFTCVHPQDSNLAIDFSYCARAPLEAKLETRSQEARAFLQAVQFEKLSQGELSTALYNSGLTMRHRGEFRQAETMFKRALATQEQLTGPDSEASGRRMAELAAVLLVQGKVQEGVPLVQRLVPLSEGFSASERRFLAKLFGAYAEEIVKADGSADVGALEAKAKALDDQGESKQ